MGLYLVTGVMGGGKSYLGAEVCMQAFKEGAVVHTNLKLNAAEIERRGWTDQWVVLPENPHEWRSVLRKGKEGAENLMLVDEAALAFHVHDQQKSRDANREIFELLVWSRRAGLDVYFVSQSAQNLDAQLRRLTEVRIHCTKVAMFPFFGPAMALLLGDFSRRRFGGGDGKNAIGTTFHRFRKEVGDFYDTHDLHGRSLGIQEGEATRKKKSNKDSRTAIFIFVFLVLATAFGAWRFYGMFWGRTPEGDAATQSKSVVAAAVGADKKAEPVPFGPRVFTVAVNGKTLQWAIDSADDLLIASQMDEPLRIFIRGGELLQLGKPYEGDLVQNIVTAHGRYYILCASGRKLVARKPTVKEQQEWKLSYSRRQGSPSWGSSSGPDWVSGSK